MATLLKPPARWLVVIAGLIAVSLLAGCGGFGGAEATPLPTRTPLPTFTPTVEGGQPVTPPDTGAQAQATTDVAAQPPAVEGQTPASDAQPTTDPDQPVINTPAPAQTPTAVITPTTAAAQVVTNDIVNIRTGPGTAYGLAGSAQVGESFRVTGKNPEGTWWQIDYNGQTGWIFGQLVTATGTEAVAVAQNIPPVPTAPPATNTPVPQPTQPPVAEATQAPAPTQAPASTYKFNVAVVGRCDRQPAGNWFEGKTYVNGVPQSGYKVVFSYAPDGPWITEPMLTGPHEGYPGWDQGYYSHIISASGPKEGTWYVWVVDDAGNRISEMASWTSTGPGEDCNQAVVDFDSR